MLSVFHPPSLFHRLGHAFSALFLLTAASVASVALPAAGTLKMELIESRRIWDKAPHNAFTDLIHWKGQWWCTFRESAGHVGGNGGIRVLVSKDGKKWASAAFKSVSGYDLRDPKFSVMPDGRLMVVCAGSIYGGADGKELNGRISMVLFSEDGREWKNPRQVVGEDEWLWRVTWHDGIAYGATYGRNANANPPLKLYQSRDGVKWNEICQLELTGRPNETTLRFTKDGEMIALVRRERADGMGFIGRSKPPYTKWTWQTSNHRFGGQDLLQLDSGEWIVGTRDYTKRPEQSSYMLAQLMEDGRLVPLLTLPSGGDCSYPGMAQVGDELWTSYYSTHKGNTAIYFARVKIIR